MKKLSAISSKLSNSPGFSLVELLVAATVFTFVIAGVSQLFAAAMDIQRRATGAQKIQENALFLVESISREVRVSAVTGGSGCSLSLTIKHPVNKDVIYTYDRSSGVGVITREAQGGGAQPITSSDVDIEQFAFCVTGAGPDGHQARVTMPMKLTAVSARAAARSTVSLQTTIVSRDLIEELTN